MYRIGFSNIYLLAFHLQMLNESKQRRNKNPKKSQWKKNSQEQIIINLKKNQLILYPNFLS